MSHGSPAFAGLRQAADRLRGSRLSASTAASSLTQHIPSSFTWRDLASELVTPEDPDKPGRVVALKACLDTGRLCQPTTDDGGRDAAARRQIGRAVACVLSPVVGAASDYDEELGHGDETLDRRARVVQRCRAVADVGVSVLAALGCVGPHWLADTGDEDDNDDDSGNDDDNDDDGGDRQVLYTVTALADAGQPWTTDAAAGQARTLLDGVFGRDGDAAAAAAAARADWIVDGILKQYLRPLFARTRPATLTEAGRKAAFATGRAPPDRLVNAEAPAAKPWKYLDLRAVSVFAWAVERSSAALVRANWPLFIPVLLALVDDPDTAVRARGLTLLSAFVARVPDAGALLHTTGLDRVLADAVFPTLLFLPRLTPETDSLQLLPPAYAALLALAASAAAGSSRAPTATTATTIAGPATPLPPKAAADMLDRILREGVYTGYFHASEHIRIVEELVRQAGRVVEAMGLYAVKHLKDLVPLYAGILTDPFAMRYIPAVTATVDTLQTTLATCWPRFAKTPWQEETLKMLMLCWLNAEEDTRHGGDGGGDGGGDNDGDNGATAALKAKLVRAADTLLAVMRSAGVDVDAAVRPLVQQEPRLERLFRIGS